MPFGPRGRRCACGASGCWNTGLDGAALASGLGVALPADQVSFTVRVFDRAMEGAQAERRVVRRAARILGEGTAALVNALDPELVCFGGLAPALRAAAPEQLQAGYRSGLMSSRALSPPPILDGHLGASAVLAGAGEHGFDVLLADPKLEHWAGSV
jgi:predicted NBD/HSP70 family sugar kinase